MSISSTILPGVIVLALATPAASIAAAPKQVIAEVSADINNDGVKDRAVLLHDPDGDDVDLAVYLSAGGKLPSQPSAYKAALGWTGDMAGALPEVSRNPAGSLVVVFQNQSIGRDRWRQQFTIAFRGGALVVAGYDYEDRDTLAPDQGGNCDVNFLSGHASRNGKAARIAIKPIALSDWTDKSAPAICTF
jgi:hypothetical protein